MTRLVCALVAATALVACNSNTAPGNDTGAKYEPPTEAAPQMGASEALANVSAAILQPGTMSEAEIRSVAKPAGGCAFSMTRIGFPSFLYGQGDEPGIIKLNGKLVTLPASGDGYYRDGGLVVRLRPFERSVEGEQHSAELVVMLPGAKDELGFRGFAAC